MNGSVDSAHPHPSSIAAGLPEQPLTIRTADGSAKLTSNLSIPGPLRGAERLTAASTQPAHPQRWATTSSRASADAEGDLMGNAGGGDLSPRRALALPDSHLH